MIVRKILVPVSGRLDPDDPEDLDAPALKAALAVAARHDAHVEVLCVTAEPARPGDEWSAWLPGYGADELIRWIEEENEERRRRAKATFDRQIAALEVQPQLTDDPARGFSVRFTEEVGDIPGAVGAAGRLSDLVVLAGAGHSWESPFRPLLQASLRRSACPVLVTPPQVSPGFATRVALAWNDTVEAARAVAASLELLKAAEKVLVICSRESETAGLQAEPLVEYLAWHGIEAEAAELSESPRDTPAAIVERARAADCDLLVLGAFLHSRAHTLLFGSVTEFVVSEPGIPVLLVP
ncbi:Nucleotide-binding universal stress protein, UspA family [Tistlia consotensis]|uniref:Nucleotide-binding universal stress protein, UspA family n=1 Tax=Tistlia consotensis USBA 355 TaxID=560819 RepID=A0A1Y6BMJ1_9PROT|nr:universal stress protein [Tistlia consotensis]SMF19152.1 Nucleotide-binding universal stress protein, UspA family [Tistlia consotensis USBA 355]SNR39191.1 Nucleotide-binding universal stress protein, UspA family [Tistlia consotensis]